MMLDVFPNLSQLYIDAKSFTSNKGQSVRSILIHCIPHNVSFKGK